MSVPKILSSFAAKELTMLVYIHGAKCIGIKAVPVTVEVEIGGGIGIHLVGLADAAVKESLLRTVTALQAKGFHIPGRKIIINLAPADMHKQGSGYDITIALGIIAASGQRSMPHLEEYLIMGEMGLDGSIRYVSGTLPMVELAREKGYKGCIFPEQSALEAADFTDILIYGVQSLDDVLRILADDSSATDLLIWNTAAYNRALMYAPDCRKNYMDFADIMGQEGAKRGAEIACAGGHNMLLIGAPGSGKSSLAKALPGILPPMSLEEAVITSKIYSVAGKSSGKERPLQKTIQGAAYIGIESGGAGRRLRRKHHARGSFTRQRRRALSGRILRGAKKHPGGAQGPFGGSQGDNFTPQGKD